MSRLKDFLTELAKSLDDIEAARKISGLDDKEIQKSYLESLQKKHGLGHTWFTSNYGGQLIIYMSNELYGRSTIEVTAKDNVELTKFLQKKGLKTNSNGFYIYDGRFDEEKGTIRIGIPDSEDAFYSHILFKPKEGGVLEIDYELLRNPLTYDIAEYIENNLTRNKMSILCCAR
jgi:hypothetical protein